jgi:hypothetical protein
MENSTISNFRNELILRKKKEKTLFILAMWKLTLGYYGTQLPSA